MSDTRDLKTLKTQPTPRPEHGGEQDAGLVDDAVIQQSAPDKSMPLMGLFAVGFALMGIFASWVFVPFGLVLGLVCLFMGQIGLGLLAIMLSVIGFLTSPTLLVMLGLGALGAWFSGLGF